MVAHSLTGRRVCRQWGRLPLHWAAIKKAPPNIIESLLVAFPEAARMKDSCPQVVPADLAKTPVSPPSPLRVSLAAR